MCIRLNGLRVIIYAKFCLYLAFGTYNVSDDMTFSFMFTM